MPDIDGWTLYRAVNAVLALDHAAVAGALLYVAVVRWRVGCNDHHLPLLLGVFVLGIFPSRLARTFGTFGAIAAGVEPDWWLLVADMLASASSLGVAFVLVSNARRISVSPSIRRFQEEVDMRRAAEGRLSIANARMKARLVVINRQRNALMAVIANSSLTPEQQQAVKELVEALN